MSTIVKYKDNTLTTIENETKTIKTANKWMEDNLILEKTDSENPAVYQDENGYIVIDDDGNRVSTRSLIANANGTYTAPTGFAYNDISVRVPVSNTTKRIIDRSITSVSDEDLPNATILGISLFRDCTSLTTVNLPNVLTLRDYAFSGCTALTTANFPNVKEIYQYTFDGCTSLQNIYLPNFIGNTTTNGQLTYFARSCSSLVNVVLPSFTGRVNSNAFRYCTNLTKFDSSTTSIQNNNNFTTTALNTLIIRGNTVCTLAGTNSFDDSPFASGGTGGTLYVPSALISSYESATNWSTILGYENNQILPIEGSIYETQYADGTPISN